MMEILIIFFFAYFSQRILSQAGNVRWIPL